MNGHGGGICVNNWINKWMGGRVGGWVHGYTHFQLYEFHLQEFLARLTLSGTPQVGFEAPERSCCAKLLSEASEQSFWATLLGEAAGRSF